MDFISTLGYDLAASRRADDHRAVEMRMRRASHTDVVVEPERAPRREPAWHHVLAWAHLARPWGQPVAH